MIFKLAETLKSYKHLAQIKNEDSNKDLDLSLLISPKEFYFNKINNVKFLKQTSCELTLREANQLIQVSLSNIGLFGKSFRSFGEN